MVNRRAGRLAATAIAVGLLFGGAVFGGAVSVAGADHWHEYPAGTWNGVVHGSSTIDGSFFARVETSGSFNYNYCLVGDNSGWYATNYKITLGTDTCSDWSQAHNRSWINECKGVASVGKDGYVSIHTHYGHYYATQSCNVQFT